MRRTALLIAIACAVAGLVSTSGSATAAEQGTLDRPAATQLLALVNAERVANGLEPVTDDPALRGWAEQWSLHMAGTGVLAHNDALFTRSAHSTLRIKVFAENVAWDDAQFGVLGAHNQFRNSPHHHDNMLGSAYRLAGFAVARDSKGRVWVTEDFGTPRTAVAAPAPAPRPASRPVTAAPAPPRPAVRKAAVVQARPVVATRPATPKPARANRSRKLAPAPFVVVRGVPESNASEMSGVARRVTASPTSYEAPSSSRRRDGTPLFFLPFLVLALASLVAVRIARQTCPAPKTAGSL
jgi:hypothetical protein